MSLRAKHAVLTMAWALICAVSLSCLSAESAYAADNKRAKKGGKGSREKFITREATVKGKEATKVDFDSIDIGGQRKTPLGTLVNQNKADKNYDFVKIRLRWHPEMVQSASSLDSGKSSQ